MRALASAISEICMRHPKFKTCHGWFVVHRLGLATVNLYTKYEVSTFTHYEDMTRGSAIVKRWSLGLIVSVGGLKRRGCDNQSPSCAHLLIAARRVARRIVSKSTVAQIKMDHVSKTTPLLGVICHPFWEGLIWSPLVKKFESSSFSHF